MNVYARALELVDTISAAGIRATLDTRNVNPPCVLVTQPDATMDLYAGHASITWRLVAIVPGPSSADAFKALWAAGGILPTLDTLDGIDIADARPYQYTDNTTALELTWNEAL